MSDSDPLGALDGVRIVDLTQMLAGPYCTMLLADQGAEIIKVEPLDGDHTRIIGPYHADDKLRAFGGYFASVNRNKKSIAIDLKTPEGRDLVLKLCDDADAVVENYRGGVMDRLGLSYETLHARNRKLVYATIRGFGDARTGKSPYSDWPAYDVISQAMGGIMAITGPDKDTPMKVGPGVGDIVPAITCAFGIVSAILRAYKTGKGQFVDVGMVDAILAVCERIMHQHSYAQDPADTRRQSPSPALPVRHVPGQGRLRHHRRARRHALPRPLPPDRQARDGNRPALRDRAGPACQPGNNQRRRLRFHAPAHQAGAAG